MAILVRKREFRRLLLRFKHGADIKSESLAEASVPARIARLPGPRPGGLQRCGAVAQLGERRVRNAKVEGSIPFRSTSKPTEQRRSFRSVRSTPGTDAPPRPGPA